MISEYAELSDDLPVLIREGYVKITDPETCEWLKSKTSLAEYFKWIGGETTWVTGGFWAPIETVFEIKRHTLRKLAGNNANPFKPDGSKDFTKIKAIFQPLRVQEEKQQNEMRIFQHIKHLILLEAENEEPETIHKILQKTSAIFVRNVDKNVQNL